LFFTFDDDVAQELYASADFDVDDKETRRVYISVGNDRFIHLRTLSFSRKQSEIKVSLCKETTKDGLGALSSLYDWFAPRGTLRPDVVQVVGVLARRRHQGKQVWELALEEPVDLVSPPGLRRRRKKPSRSRKAFIRRREIHERQLRKYGKLAEKRALTCLAETYPPPGFSCLWRDGFLDSERIEIRKQGIICDIDIWNNEGECAEAFYEVKAQQVQSKRTRPMFYLSSAEWKSMKAATKKEVPYRIWLVQYESLEQLQDETQRVRIVECEKIETSWINPEVLLVFPDPASLRTVSSM
jgi:hypothetical protein